MVFALSVKMICRLMVVLVGILLVSVSARRLVDLQQGSVQGETRLFDFLSDFYAEVVYPPLNHIVTSSSVVHFIHCSLVDSFRFGFVGCTSVGRGFLKMVFLHRMLALKIFLRKNVAISSAIFGTMELNRPLKMH